MENISPKLKERFCRDYKVPIKIFEEPYFSSRLSLYDKVKSIMPQYNRFLEELKEFRDEQTYNEHYAMVKDKAIDCIKGSAGYDRFNTMDMNQYAVKNKNLPSKDIYKPTNNGREFISIDIRKANFSCLRIFDPEIFGGAETWEEFISNFTDSAHIIESKYIRQVIFGNCNCKRHITFERYIMDGVLTRLIERFDILDKVVFFSNDEVVLDVTDYTDEDKSKLYEDMSEYTATDEVPLKVEMFKLYKIGGANGYYKKRMLDDGTYEIEFKGIDNFTAPFIFRRYLDEDVQYEDKVFVHEGMLAEFMEVPCITL